MLKTSINREELQKDLSTVRDWMAAGDAYCIHDTDALDGGKTTTKQPQRTVLASMKQIQ